MASTGRSDGSSRDKDEKYHLLLELGQGGSAQVFLAVMDGGQGVDKLVVLKFLKASLSNDTELQKMFLSEARFSARLNHANIVQTSAIVQERGGPAIVMEYLEGQSLSAILARARATIPLALHVRILADTLRGLHYAHELTDIDGKPYNVVHRDVSPQNVFVTYDGQVKLIDFGIAKLAGSGVETETGIVKGKLRYMPPEQVESRDVDRRADVFAVGVMLWEAATREKVWKGRPDAAVLRDVLCGEIQKPLFIRPDVPEELERIILKALSSNRDNRHATAADLEADLEAFLSEGTQVTGRDVSKFVSSEFATVRAETKRVIELHLKRRAAMADTTSTSGGEAAPPALAQSLARNGYATTNSTQSTVVIPARAPKRRVTVAVALASVAAIAIVLRKVGPTIARPDVAVATAPSSTAPPSPGPIESAMTSSSVVAPPQHMAGSLPSVVAVTKPQAAPQRPRVGRVSVPPAIAKAPAAPPPSDQCNPPFFMDKNGIKRPKAECL